MTTHGQRRRAGQTAILLGTALMAFVAGGGCASTPTLQRYEFTRPEMGVPFRIALYADDEGKAREAAEAAFARVARLNAILSDYDPDSEMNRLCHETTVGQPAPVSEELGFMLERSLTLSRASDGAFDVTVGPFVNLWRRARRRLELPAESLLAEAKPSVGWRNLRYDPKRRSVTFLAPAMRLDFGGIAKGYAADEACRVLKSHGFSRALAGAAGDIAVGDPPPGQSGWRIQVDTSDATNAPAPRLLILRRAAVSTGGDTFQRLEIGGRRYSHIVDPRTGIGLTNRILVTAVARDGSTSDGLETAVSVLGVDRGLRLVSRIRGAEVSILVERDGRTERIESPGFRRLVESPVPGGTSAGGTSAGGTSAESPR